MRARGLRVLAAALVWVGFSACHCRAHRVHVVTADNVPRHALSAVVTTRERAPAVVKWVEDYGPHLWINPDARDPAVDLQVAPVAFTFHAPGARSPRIRPSAVDAGKELAMVVVSNPRGVIDPTRHAEFVQLLPLAPSSCRVYVELDADGGLKPCSPEEAESILARGPR